MKIILIPVICLLAATSVLSQTQPYRLLVDKIAAVVGDQIILQSDMTHQAEDKKRHGTQTFPVHDCALLRQLIMQRSLVLQAQKDSLYVSEEDLAAELEQRIQYFVRLYGSKEALEEIAGKTIYQIKEDSRTAIRQYKLAEAQQRLISENVKVTPHEVQQYYSNIPKDSLSRYEAEYEIRQIVLFPRAGTEMEQYAKDELSAFKNQVETGKNSFEKLASVYSDDMQTKGNGGYLACNRNDKHIDATFLQTVFSLREGQISRIVKTHSGYHLIQLISRSGDDAVVRHILKTPLITDKEIAKTVADLDTIRARLISNTLSFGDAIDRYNEDPNGRFTAGLIYNQYGDPFATISELDQTIVAELGQLNVGAYSKPVMFVNQTGRKGVRILYLQNKTNPHIENLKDDYRKIADRLTVQKKNEAVEKWFHSHIPFYHIAVSREYRECEHNGTWLPVTRPTSTRL